MIILEDKHLKPSKEEMDLLVKNFQAVKAGLEKSKKIYHRDIFVIEPLVEKIGKILLPKMRIHQTGFPVNTFRFAFEDFAKAIEDLNPHEVYKYREDVEFIASWLTKNLPKNEIIIGS